MLSWRSALFGALLSTIVLLCLAADPVLVEYYVTLIYSNIVASMLYVLPTRNEEFASVDIAITDIGSFDFVIVGAGAAGSILAARLSEISRWNVLLLEAGGEETDFADVPAMFPYVQYSDLNWGYFTTVQTQACQGMVNQQCSYPRGKVLGGSSTINAMMYVRGNKADYDTWESLGNPGWSYGDILPYFKKSEHAEVLGNSEYHGYGGPVTVSYTTPPLPTTEAFLGAHLELGKLTIDYNGANQIGGSLMQGTVNDGKRVSTNQAFLSEARGRSNLEVVTNALVTKVSIDGASKTAKGVLFTKDHLKFRAEATKEVIVSAGSINTPQLLMLSGIGPRSQLESFGIPVIENLPVGQNLKEHPIFLGLAYRTNEVVVAADLQRDVARFLDGHGYLTAPFGVSGIGFTQAQPNGAPLIEYLYQPASGQAGFSQTLVKTFNFNEEVNTQFFSKLNSSTDFLIAPILLHEKSTGSVTLKSFDPLDFPNIDLNFFSDPDGKDIEALYQSVRFIQRLMQTRSFRSLNATPLDHGTLCSENEYDSREYWYCLIRLFTNHLYHPIRTTKMGPNRATSVVDSHLKVHGLKKLRVVDAGVFPSTTSGHTYSPTMAVAEKISDEIKRSYGGFW